MLRLARLISLIICASALQAVSRADAPTSTAPASAPDFFAKPLKLAIVANNADKFWQAVRLGAFQAQTDDPGINVMLFAPQAGDASTQQKLVNDLLTWGADAIAIAPVDPANQAAFLDNVAGRTLLVTTDVDAPATKRSFFVGIDNIAAGKQAGDALKKAIPEGGKVAIFVGSIDAKNAADRLNGLRQAVKGTKIELLDPVTDGVDSVKAKQNVSDALANHPDIAGMVGLWSYNGSAILSALDTAGQAGKIKVVCFDDRPDVLAGIKAGKIEATVVQQPVELGKQTVKLLAQTLRGQPPKAPDNHIIVPMLVVDAKNLNEYSEVLKKIAASDVLPAEVKTDSQTLPAAP